VKLSIALRFGLVLALAGVLASGLTGYYVYTSSRTLLVHAAEERLLTATRVLLRQVTVEIDDTTRILRFLAEHPRARLMLTTTDPAARTAIENDIAGLFTGILKTRPEFFQVRLIARTEHGMERIRVDRDRHGVLRVSGDDLQEKGHFPYVFETLGLPVGEVYISTPVINHEHGAHAGEEMPSMHIAAPIRDADNVAIGLIVINVDLNGIFKQLATDLSGDIGIYLANANGDFLVHPDVAQAFAFDRGKRALMQDQFPAATALVDGDADHVITSAQAGAGHATRNAVVAAFAKQHLNTPQRDAYFILGLSQPMETVLQDSEALGAAILRIILAFSALSIIPATLLSRAVTSPIDQMVRAVKRFTLEQTREPLPTARNDEIGVLARSFDDMQQQIQLQMGSLHTKQRELDHLASHDPLTGLPNRRVFLDRLEHALARARRGEKQLAILFIDLDKFKDINDSLGHAVGDIMLRAAAERLRTTVRETDTVARLGGDEFIVLSEDIGDIDAAALIARKIIESLATPVPYREQALTVGASIGIAIYPRDGITATEVIASADQAMYRAKLSGRNRYCVASEPTASGKTIPLDL
jgi:diguanylate cyclase (GGDEF)-like protein